MESRKMVQKNLSAGQEQRCRHRESTCGQSGKGAGGTNWERSMHKTDSWWEVAL